MRPFVLALLALSLASAGESQGAPFGFDETIKVESLEYCANSEAPGEYICSSAPKPHSLFDEYRVLVDGTGRTCVVRAVSTLVDTNRFGEGLRSKFATLSEQIGKTYGRPEEYGFLRNGSLWDEREYWMMSLLKKDRTLAHIWNPEGGVDWVKILSLEASALSTEKGVLIVQADSPGGETCLDALKQSDEEAF